MEPIGPARGRSHREAVIVAVRGADGALGLGEAAPLPGMSIDAIDDVERAVAEVVARLPEVIETRDDACRTAAGVEHVPAARFAVETALLAALAQRARRSVASLWGARDGVLRCAWVVDDEAGARAAIAAGARCLKVKAGAGDDVARVARIARAAPGARLRVDANGAWPRGEVRARMAELAAVAAAATVSIEYVEEPCARAHEWLEEASAGLALPVALDESLAGLGADELARALRAPGLAAVVLKPTLLGGFARCVAIAAAARDRGVAAVVSHALEGPIGTAACAEVARVVRGGAEVEVDVGLAPHPALARWAEATWR